MTDKEIVKKAFEQAEQDARDKQVAEVKKIVTKTLEKLDAVKKELKAKHEEERLLKMDIDDLKEGRLDRIAERQDKDPEAKKVSVVLIIKEKEVIREVPSPWYFPYQVIWQIPYVPTYYGPVYTTNTIDCHSGSTNLMSTCISGSIGNASNCTLSDGSNFQATVTGVPMSITCSVAKSATVGAYTVGDHIVHLR